MNDPYCELCTLHHSEMFAIDVATMHENEGISLDAVVTTEEEPRADRS